MFISCFYTFVIWWWSREVCLSADLRFIECFVELSEERKLLKMEEMRRLTHVETSSRSPSQAETESKKKIICRFFNQSSSQVDSSPYNSAYLSPPPDPSWRRYCLLTSPVCVCVSVSMETWLQTGMPVWVSSDLAALKPSWSLCDTSDGSKNKTARVCEYITARWDGDMVTKTFQRCQNSVN